MRTLSFALVLGCLAVPAFADELADAQKLWENKQFTAAFTAFGKLAAAGNPAAQLQLGEMYGFGEGTKEDLAQARNWLEKAAKAGQPDAANSLALVNQRAARKADIGYYMDKFDGGTARYENFNCIAPTFPQVSDSKASIESVGVSIDQWKSCYTQFANNLNRVAGPEKTIPADVLNLMNNEEYQQASRHIGKTYDDIINIAQKNSSEVTANINGWVSRTGEYLKKKNVSDNQLMTMLRAQRAADAANFGEAMLNRNETLGKRK